MKLACMILADMTGGLDNNINRNSNGGSNANINANLGENQIRNRNNVNNRNDVSDNIYEIQILALNNLIIYFFRIHAPLDTKQK